MIPANAPEYGPDRVRVVADIIRWAPTHPQEALQALRTASAWLTREDLVAALVVAVNELSTVRGARA